MPYIARHRRSAIDAGGDPETAGELNYAITRLLVGYMEHGESRGYGEINEIVGVLECAKLEFYQRIAVPYEDKKIKQNGDVYE